MLQRQTCAHPSKTLHARRSLGARTRHSMPHSNVPPGLMMKSLPTFQLSAAKIAHKLPEDVHRCACSLLLVLASAAAGHCGCRLRLGRRRRLEESACCKRVHRERHRSGQVRQKSKISGRCCYLTATCCICCSPFLGAQQHKIWNVPMTDKPQRTLSADRVTTTANIA